MSQQPTPSVEPLSASSSTDSEPTIGSVTILVYDWASGQSQVRMQFPPEAQSGQPGALAAQAKFRARLITDLDDAFRILGGP